MRVLRNLNISKSIANGKLIIRENWFEKLDRIMVFFFHTIFFCMPFLVFFDPHKDSNQEGIEYYLLFTLSLFSLYVIYRKFSEFRLCKITSRNTLDENKELIKEFFLQKGYELNRNSKKLLVFNSDNGFSSNYKTSRIFLFDGNDVYFTMIKSNFRMNLPVLFSHFFVQNEIKKLLK